MSCFLSVSSFSDAWSMDPVTMVSFLARNMIPTFYHKNLFFRPFSFHKLGPRKPNKELTNALRVLKLVSPKTSVIDIENRSSHLRLVEDILDNSAMNPLGDNSVILKTVESSVLDMEQGLGIDVCFLSHALSSCGCKRDLYGGIQYHCLAITTGFIANVYVGSSLISLYARCGLLDDAYRVFDEMPERNVVSWTAIITGFAQEWHVDMCLKLFHQMRGLELKPNYFTYTSLLSACMSSGALGHGRGIHGQIIQMGFLCYLHVDNALIAMYSKCGAIDDALYIFKNMVNRDIVTWNSMIVGYAHHGLAQEAIGLFEEMIKQGVYPDAVTFLGILSSCRHGGLVKEGQVYFSSMVDHGLQPELDHYSCIVDLFGRAGLLLEALDFINNMPVCPNAVIWGSLLSRKCLDWHPSSGKQVIVGTRVLSDTSTAGKSVCKSWLVESRSSSAEIDERQRDCSSSTKQNLFLQIKKQVRMEGESLPQKIDSHFHIGKDPKGDQTDWVVHEFRLEDKDLADKGIAQKEGPGPRNGAQYGKPFNEKDWDSEGEIDCLQCVPAAAVSLPAPILPSSSHISVANDMDPSTSGCIGLNSLSCLSRLMPSGLPHSSAPSNQIDDDILSMLGIFKDDDDTLAGNENNGSEKVDNPGQANNAEGEPYFDPNEIFGDLGDLESLVGLDDGDGFSHGQKDEYTKNEMPSTGGDVSFVL